MTTYKFQTKYGVTYKGYPHGVDADGKPLYRVDLVPVFSECEDTRCTPGFMYGREWLEEAVSNLRELEAKKHFKPVHFGHHEGMENKPKLGKMVNFTLSDLPGYGLTIFADLVDIPEETFTRMKNGAIPFRSVEIPSPRHNKPIISSLALLSSQDPYHEYPNLIVEEVATGAAFQTVAFSKDGNRIHAIFSYDMEIPMPKKDKDKEKFMAPGAPAPAAPAAPAAPVAPAQPAMDPMAMIQQLQQQIAQLQAEIEQLKQGGKESEQPPAASAQPGKMSKRGNHMQDNEMAKQFARQGAEILQLKSMLKNQSIDKEVDRFIATVEREGTTLDTNELRRSAHTFAKQGPEAFETFANHVLINNIPPASHLPSASNFSKHDPLLDEYEGDAREVAHKALELYHANKGKMLLGTTKAQFVRGQVRAHFPQHFNKKKAR